MTLPRNEEEKQFGLTPEAVSWTLEGFKILQASKLAEPSHIRQHRLPMVEFQMDTELGENNPEQNEAGEYYWVADSDASFIHSAVNRYKNSKLQPLVNLLNGDKLASPETTEGIERLERYKVTKPSELERAEIFLRELAPIVNRQKEAIALSGQTQASKAS